MVKVFGSSDDLVEIEGSSFKNKEIDCYNKSVRVRFVDGTVIRVRYGKPNLAVWCIEIEVVGSSASRLDICNDENAEIYSDVFQIESEVECVVECVDVL